MSKAILSIPDRVVINENEVTANGSIFTYGDATVTLKPEEDILSVSIKGGADPLKRVSLLWKDLMVGAGRILSDTWERAYGDLCWRDSLESGVMPWYFLSDEGAKTRGFGVKVRPKAMCYFEIKGSDLILTLDIRNGSEGALLNGRELKIADIVMREYPGADVFLASQSFCKELCDDPILPDAPVYGGNNWYYAYGVSSREDILRDSEYLSKLTEGNVNRPFMVIDDGWQTDHSESYNGGPWNDGNRDYGDMGKLAHDMKALNVRPGIWFRPLLDSSDAIPGEWKFERDKNVLDISVPEVVDHVKEDIRRICGWGFELIKHDFSTFDIFGIWGFEMGSDLTHDKWTFKDRTRTNAEIIIDFYKAIREAAGDVMILGCNVIGHLAAGLVEANRTGDDTSGVEWERTRKMGVNTLAFRMPQHGAFFGADADCVGITEKIEWRRNRQWLEILSLSGTPFFVSVKPGTLSPEQESELKKAYRKASENNIPAVPLDWKEGKLPTKWNTFEGTKEYNWD